MSAIPGSGFRRSRHNNDDSSSSRESSPKPGYKRGFTPNSDDDIVVPPLPDQDTPPPQAPLLRQAVGFSFDTASAFTNSAPITTYEAAISTAQIQSQYSLPGQEIVVSPPPPSKKPAKPKRKPGEPRPSTYVRKKNVRHSNDEYANQTTSFRIKQYDASMPTNLPIQGQGPYNSLFRVDTYKEPALPDPAELPTGGGVFRVDGGRVTPKPKTKTPRASSKSSTSKTASARSGTPAKQSTSSASSGTMSSATPPVHSIGPASPAAWNPGDNDSSREQSVPVEKRQSYYRHDYGNNSAAAAPTPQASQNNFEPDFSHQESNFGSPTPSSTTLIESNAMNSTPSTSTVPQRDHQSSPGSASTDGAAAKRVAMPRRLITILIRDIRSGVDDDQLAEVKVPLRPAEDPGDGFWTDAKEVCEQLQAGPSRIDGPARVYTLRGKYRQFFLRVSADNKDTFTPVNVIVAPDKTLEVIVENLPMPGSAPLPPQIPKDMRLSSTPESESDDGINARLAELESLKRKRSLGAADYGGIFNDGQSGQSIIMGPNGIVASDSTAVKPPRKKRTYTKAANREIRQQSPARLPSPRPNTDPEARDKMIAEVVADKITKDPAWMDFMRSTAQPPTVQEMLSQYRFVQAKVDEWEGHRAPFETVHCQVEKKHVLQALSLSPKWGSDCTETLNLLALYGPHGSRLQDEIVKNAIADTTIPKPGSRPVKRLMRHMRQLDEEWQKVHSHAMAPHPTMSISSTLMTEFPGLPSDLNIWRPTTIP